LPGHVAGDECGFPAVTENLVSIYSKQNDKGKMMMFIYL
jgi:hypothetical protein